MTVDSIPVEAGQLQPSSLEFPVVGLGASAGGLSALLRFFEAMPSDSGMAFVVILHLSPEHASQAHTVLQGVTRMKAVQVNASCHIEPNHIYVIPPSKQLSMNDSYLRVTQNKQPRHIHAEIDLFFRSLAMVHRERAFAIVLSGTGSDGAVGIAKVKEQGGITLAQAPEDADFEGMPNAAIATGIVDWVLPVAEMPGKLLEIWKNRRSIQLPPLADDEDLPVAAPLMRSAAGQDEEALRDILTLLKLRTGHDFQHYKRATVLRRLERRLQVHALPTLLDYRALLQEQTQEAHALLKDLLIGVTNFFRDREAFEALEQEVMPQLFAAERGAEAVRAWVAGCASGEEAYSVAMLLCEQAAAKSSPPGLQVFATDIDEQAISLARAALYPESIVADVPLPRLHEFFYKESTHYRIRKEVRETVLFAAHNLLRDPPFSQLDLICCRNLLIYLGREVQPQILEMFHFALRPGGYLFLGSSESADVASLLFSVVDKKNRIYRANKVAPSSRYRTALPLTLGESRPPGPREPATERRRISYTEVHRRLVEQYAPPSVLVDAEANIVYLSEQAGRFLRHTGGAPSHHLLTLLCPELRLELRTALFQALQSGKSVEARRVRIERDERSCYVKMTVRPVHEPELGIPLVLVLFDEVEESTEPDGLAATGEERDPLVLQLEEELKRTKEQLQETIEQYETSTEELKASNEELQSINEELRSATEELETSKEELQSINEELITVNHELKSKVEEAGKITDDLQNLITSTDIATVFIDRAMSIKRYTPRAAQIFNLIPSDEGRSLFDIRHRLDYEQLADDAAQAFQSLRLIEREVASSDGRWYLARLLPYRTTEDRIDGAVLTFIDITGRRNAEEQLRRGEERMRLVAESMKDYAILTLDLDGRIVTWNKGAERLFGYTESEILGKPSELLFLPEDRANGAAEDELRRAREDGRSEDDRWHLRREGRRVFCSGITTPLYRDSVLQGYAKIARDVTSRVRLDSEREARLAQEEAGRAEAQAASEMKDEFLAILSHELKNPLNLIQMNAELLVRLPQVQQLPAVQAAARTIRETVRSQAQIIDDLLDLSRLSTGKLALDLAEVDLGTVVRRLVDAMAQDVARKGLALHIEAPAETMLLHADRVRVEQIVWNLLSNAIKFTSSGGEIAVRLAQESGFARLEVSDTGKGIEPAFLPKMFDMFQQAEGRSIRREGGLGIGLALVRQLAELHGGHVEARSDGPGQGSAFVVRLPLLGYEATQALEPPQPGQQEFAGLQVLLVDDDRQAVETLGQLLELEGVNVTVALSAKEALGCSEARDYDLIVSDIAMPEMDGLQLASALRVSARHAETPLVALTGFGRPTDVERARSAGFDLHLGKPVRLELLLQAMRSLVLHRRSVAGHDT